MPTVLQDLQLCVLRRLWQQSVSCMMWILWYRLAPQSNHHKKQGTMWPVCMVDIWTLHKGYINKLFHHCVPYLPLKHQCCTYNKLLERFSSECRKTKTKAITTANHIKRKSTQWTNKNSKQIHVTGAKRGKTHVTKSWLVLVLHLIGWEGGTSFFFNQSQNVVKQNQSNLAIIFDSQLKTVLLNKHGGKNCLFVQLLLLTTQKGRDDFATTMQ